MNWVLGTLAVVFVGWKVASWATGNKKSPQAPNDVYTDKNDVAWTIYKMPSGAVTLSEFQYEGAYKGHPYNVFVSETTWPTATSRAALIALIDAYAAIHTLAT